MPEFSPSNGHSVENHRLTDREREFLTLIAEDLTAKEIADRMGISLKTVEYHRENIKRKMSAKGTGGMVRYAIRTGLITP